MTMLPKNILVPTDMSDGAEEALDFACELAQTFGATVHLLNVVGILLEGARHGAGFASYRLLDGSTNHPPCQAEHHEGGYRRPTANR